MNTDGGQPGVAEVMLSWTWSPVADLLIAVFVIGYLVAARRYRHEHPRRWPGHRTAFALIAACLATACVNSALAVYGRNLLWVHMIVHLLMIMAVPAFAVWAQPIRLMHHVVGAHTQRLLIQVGRSRVARWLVMPWVTVPAYSVVLVGTHLTDFQHVMMQHMWLHPVELVMYLISGYLLLLPIVGRELSPVAVPPILGFVVLALCMAPDTLVGVVLMLTATTPTSATAAQRNWEPSVLADQSIAGAIMWWGGDGLMMVLMLVIAAHWVGTVRGRRGGLGRWLENARRQTVLGTEAAVSVDDDAAALDAYNARLAALHGMAGPTHQRPDSHPLPGHAPPPALEPR